VVGALVRGREKQPSLARAARYDGIFPAVARAAVDQSGITPETFAEIVQRVRAFRREAGIADEPFDFVVEGDSYHGFVDVEGNPSDWAAAGATWWIESWWDMAEGPDALPELRDRISAGPPQN
jgi:hypothetical protein